MLNNWFSREVKLREGLPVLPGAFPFLGHVPQIFIGNGPRVLQQAHDTLGPLFWINQAGEWVLFCRGAEGLEPLKSKSVTTQHLKNAVPVMIGESLFGQDGAMHQHMRSAMSWPFTPRGLASERVGSVTADVITERVDRWMKSKRIRVLPTTQEAALAMAFRILGVEVADQPAWIRHYRVFMRSLLLPHISFPGSPTYQGAKARKWIDARIDRLVQHKRRDPGPGSLLSALVHAKDDKGKELTNTELIDNVRFLVMASHETMATAMAWLILTLASRPDLLDALLDEVSREAALPVDPQQLKKFPFADALFREVLRLYTPVFFTNRKVTDWIEIHNHRVRPGTIISVSLRTVTRDPARYPDPDRFDPWRWVNREAMGPLDIAPFGFGPHFCLGYHVAWMELIQASVALGLALRRTGLRLRLFRGRAPREVSGPVMHPNASASVEFY